MYATGDLGDFTGVEGQSGKECVTYQPDTGKLHSSYIGMNVCGSAACDNGCVVNGMCTMVPEYYMTHMVVHSVLINQGILLN